MVRRKWDLRASSIVAVVSAATAAAGAALGWSFTGVLAAAAVTGAVSALIIAASAIVSSARSAMSPPSRNELAPSDNSEAPPLPELDLTRRNPLLAATTDKAAALPAALHGCDLESTDGSFDLRISSGEPFDHVRPIDLLAGAPSRRAVEAPVAIDLPPEPGTIWLIPGARYHVHELGPLAEELNRIGANCAFVCVERPGRGLVNELAKWSARYHVVTTPDAIKTDRPRALVSMKDWGTERDFVRAAQLLGVPTFAKVEGAQDFRNRDTIRRTLPYQIADYVLCQGPYDAAQIGDRAVVVGSCRLEAILAIRDLDLTESTAGGYVVANYNFSYGTRDYAAERWMNSVAEACEASGRRLAASVHPAVPPPASVTTCPFPLALELERAEKFVTRCSTALFDAAAMGTPVAYFNPHREQAWRDLPFGTAVPQLRSRRDLSRWLENAHDGWDARPWLLSSFLSVESAPSERRMAECITGAS